MALKTCSRKRNCLACQALLPYLQIKLGICLDMEKKQTEENWQDQANDNVSLYNLRINSIYGIQL